MRLLLFVQSSEGVSEWDISYISNKGGLSQCVTFSPGSKILIAAVLMVVSAALFLCPLYIQTQCPCLIKDLPKKPDFIGHRGAPMVSIPPFHTD